MTLLKTSRIVPYIKDIKCFGCSRQAPHAFAQAVDAYVDRLADNAITITQRRGGKYVTPEDVKAAARILGYILE